VGIALVIGGLLFVWLATEAGWFGLDSASAAGLPLRLLLIALGVLTAIWLWRRRARWH
jgi:membrane protein implicated in regulation of membrane protease activity